MERGGIHGKGGGSSEPFDIIIIGASGGIGQYLVRAFKDEHRVLGTYCHSSPDALEPGAEYYRLDVTDRQAVSGFTAEISPTLKRPALIYTSGVSLNGVIHKTRDEDWDLTLSVNLTGAMLVSRGLLPRMRELCFGRIIFISSVLSRISVPGTAAYSASKAALCALAKVIAVENARKGITANALALGYFNVGIIRAVPEAYLNEQVLPSIPQGRLGDAVNIGAAVRFIMDADYLTGAVLDINGGIITG